MGYQAVVLVSFGGPEQPGDVMPFLERVTAGRGVPRQRVEAVAEHYYRQAGVSPINSQCRAVLSHLAGALAGTGLSLFWGNRNWHPLLEDTMAEMRDAGIERALALVTSAYGGYSSCRQYLDDISSARAKVGAGAPVIDKLRLYYNHPGWVRPWAASLGGALEAARSAVAADGLAQARSGPGAPHTGGGPKVIFSAHSIPEAMAATSPYASHVAESCALVALAAGVTEWTLAWQSRSGSPAQPWLGPDITELIASSSVPAYVVVPIGFVCDNMEVVHDLDVEAAAAAEKAGAHFMRAATIGATPAFAEMARQLVQERLSGPGASRSALGAQGPWPDFCPPGHCPAPSPPATGPSRPQ